jgi:hypothetical protein
MAPTSGDFDLTRPSRHVLSGAMRELSEDSESNADATTDERGQSASDQHPDLPDRPKLVALPVPTAESAPAADDTDLAPAEAAPAPARDAGAAGADAGRLALERSLSGPPVPGRMIAAAPLATPTADVALPTHIPALAYAPQAPQLQPQPIALPATPELVQALRAELAMRAHAEAGLRARAIDAETRLATRVLLSQRTAEALRLVRAELAQLAGLLTDERARREAAERRVAELEQQLATDRGRTSDADHEIAAVRDSLQQLRSPAEDQITVAADGESLGDASTNAVIEVRADRLNDALTRLRAGAEPIDQVPAPVGSVTPVALTPVTATVPSIAGAATLAGPFRTMCRRDPALAGQLALSLLPMQWIAYPRPVSYDIVLGPGHGCVQVTSGDDAVKVVRQATARSLEQVDFQLVGGPERFAKLLAAGRIRRRLGFWVLSRVRGNRDGLEALDALLALPLELPALVEAELTTDPLILAQLHAWIKRAQSE